MDKEKILAIVEGRNITQSDLENLLRGLPPQQSMQFNNEAGRKQLLEELINQEVLYLNAIEKGLDKSEEFKNELKKATENLVKQYAVRDILNRATVTEEEVVEFYESHKDHFTEKDTVKASHILVDSLEEANKIIEELKNGLEFEELAKKYSKCPSKERGGDLGYFTRGKMVPEFETASFKLGINEISEPVKTQFGYHIIKVLDKKDESIKPLDSVRYQIKQQIIAMKQNKLYIEETNKLKEKYNIEIK